MLILITPKMGHTYSLAISGEDIRTTQQFVSYMRNWEDAWNSLLVKHKISNPFWQSSESRHEYHDIKAGSYELFEFLGQDGDLQFQNKLLRLSLELAYRLNVELAIE